MASATTIKSRIKSRIEDSKNSTYSDWVIGITSEPVTRKKAHGDPKYWTMWDADSEKVAREVETYFLNEYPEEKSKRMKGGTGGDIDGRKTVYVYIY